MQSLSDNSTLILQVPVSAIEPAPFNRMVSITDPGIDEMAVSFRAKGVVQLVVLRPHPENESRLILIAGEIRSPALFLLCLPSGR